MMDMNEYQQATVTTAIYPAADSGTREALTYCMIGLAGETGELANKYKKRLRRDPNTTTNALVAELGDCLWYLARIADELGVPLSQVADTNLAKLGVRLESGTLQGNGDER